MHVRKPILSQNRPIAVELVDVWKVFGTKVDETIAATLEKQLSKAQVLTQFGNVVGVQSANFSVHEGEVFCIMGLSGSGKSTLVRHINRLLEPTRGQIFIQGEDIMLKDEKQLRTLRAEKIGMVFQNIALLPHRTVLDNVALPLDVKRINRRQRRETAERVLAMVELAGWEYHYAHELSGGMQQRVGLARAMAADPDILLMDEPFSALDPLIRRQLQDEFIKLSDLTNKTTIFITHDLDEAIRIGHRIAIMNDGKLVQIGTPQEIVANPVDDYVSEFVANISRLKLVSASGVMRPIEDYSGSQTLLETAPRVSDSSDLDRLIDVSIKHQGPIVIVDTENNAIGYVDQQLLLHSIKGNRSNSS